jgi:hypothetical protein
VPQPGQKLDGEGEDEPQIYVAEWMRKPTQREPEHDKDREQADLEPEPRHAPEKNGAARNDRAVTNTII